MTTRYFLSLAFACLFSFTVLGAPAKRTPVTVTQPDGSELTLVLMGDEYFHFHVTADGVPVRVADDGYYYYLTDDAVTLSPLVAHDAADRTLAEKAYVASLDREAIFSKFDARNSDMRMMRKAAGRNVERKAAKAEGEVHGLIILVNFSDTKFVTDIEEIEEMMNGDNYNKYGSIGSARQYFIDQSGGKFQPIFDIVGPVDLPQPMAYYGGNDSRGNDSAPEQMVSQACSKANRLGTVDFSRYDNDGDGVLDLVYLIYAGYNEAEGATTDAIWSHAANLTGFGLNTRVGGYLVDSYACSSELAGRGASYGKTPAGIGTFCHEYSHTLGLPDFYNTDNSNDFTMDVWSLMDYGMYNNDGYVPVGYSAYEREFCGWLDIRELKNAPERITLDNLATSYDACKIVNEDNPDEFFVFEARYKEGWDKYLPATGLMITSVAYNENIWEKNTVNNGTKKRVYVVAADNIYSSMSVSGDLYPYYNNDSYTLTSSPASRTYSGTVIDRPITNITKDTQAQSVTFDYLGGEANAVTAPVALPATNLTATSFVANWEPVAGVGSYTLTVVDDAGAEIVFEGLTGNSQLVDGLDEGGTYSYYVFARQGQYDSVNSNVITVDLGSGIEAGSLLSDVNVYVDGSEIVVDGTADVRVSVYHVSGAKVADTVCDGATVRIQTSGNGLYLVKVGEEVRKVIVE